MFRNHSNQKAELQSAAARLARLPLVRSTCDRLSLLYNDTKRCHPGLSSVCGVLESRVTAACVTASPVIEKLEPHISIANVVACKSLDWLEASFPVLLSPTDQVVASAKNKLHDIQDAVQHRLMGVMTGTHQGDDGVNRSLVKIAITVADVGMDSALSFSEALLEKVLPPEEDEGLDDRSVKGFGVATVPKCYPERLTTLAVKFCRRTYGVVGSKVQSARIYDGLASASALMQDPQSSCLILIWKLQALPEYLQQQALSIICFVFHVYHLILSQQALSNVRCHLNTSTPSPKTPSPQIHLARGTRQPPVTRRWKHARLSMFDNGCNSGHPHC